MENFNAAKKFIRPRPFGFAWGALFIALTVLGFVMRGFGKGYRDFLNIFLAAAGIYAIIKEMIALIKFKKYISSLYDSAAADEIARNFSEPESVPIPEVRLGEKYLFAKGSGRVLSYNDVKRIYPLIKRTKSTGDWLSLIALTDDGEVVLLKRKDGDTHEDVNAIVSFILSKNPGALDGELNAEK